MKNLLVYISPTGLDKERETLARVQIDNSLDLGWKPEDIVLVTNFKYEYNGIKAHQVEDRHWYPERPRSIKTTILPSLMDEGLLREDNLYWNHDFDAYQMNPMTDKEIGINFGELGLTDYGWRPRWCMGSYFFNIGGIDIFQQARDIILGNIEDERALLDLCRDPKIEKRCKRLNITYNFGMRQVEANWERATHPIRVVHFHPWYPLVPTLDIFMYGKNKLGHPIINDRLKAILNHHGIK